MLYGLSSPVNRHRHVYEKLFTDTVCVCDFFFSVVLILSFLSPISTPDQDPCGIYVSSSYLYTIFWAGNESIEVMAVKLTSTCLPQTRSIWISRQTMPINSAAKNVFGTLGALLPSFLCSLESQLSIIGTVCWTVQLVPQQLWKSHREKDTTGLSCTLVHM